jgi:hypothetical protein
LIDVREDFFYSISKTVPAGVPLVLVDSVIDDELFYKVMYDYKRAFSISKKQLKGKSAILIMEKFHNAGLTEHIKIASGLAEDDIHLMEDEKVLAEFLAKNSDQSAIILNEFLAATVSKYRNIKDDAVICTSNCPEILPAGAEMVLFKDSKANIAFKVLSDLIKDNRGLHLEKYTYIPAE